MGFFDRLHFDNHFARLGSEFFTRLPPTTLPDPHSVAANPDVAVLLDLDPAALASEQFVALGSGNWLPPGADPLAMLYAGHQFGVYVPQLGDGRAILIGQVTNARGESWDLQLKGSGRTSYSRMADGTAVLGSAIREYLCSEALYHLGVPTTRALGIVGSDYPVFREDVETAAVLLRVAPSHVRFGSFEVFFYRNQPDRIRTLADYVIARDFPELDAEPGSRASHLAFLREVVVRTARLMAHWQTIGFVHGVMNTDSMSILGLTFDLGTCGFMEAFDPDFVCNDSDDAGRYAFANQPSIAYWNLHCLAQALTPLLSVDECRDALTSFEPAYREKYAGLFRAKLGLVGAAEGDGPLMNHLLEILQGNAVDYPLFFRALADYEPGGDNAAIAALFQYPEAFDIWSEGYAARLAGEALPQSERRHRMRRANPRYVLRDWLAQRAIERAQAKDFSEIDRLLEILRRPFDDQPDAEGYGEPAPEAILVQSVSCSS